MAVTSSLTQAYSITESGGSGIATSARTSSVAPTVTMTTSATGVTMVYSTTFSLAANVIFDLDLYNLSGIGAEDADDRGTIRFTEIHGYIINVAEGVLKVGTGPSETQPGTPWTSQPVKESGSGWYVDKGSVAMFSEASIGSVTSADRIWRFRAWSGSPTDTTGSIVIIGEGTIV